MERVRYHGAFDPEGRGDMRMTGEKSKASAAVVCPTCGEVYDSPDRAAEVLRNSGFCVNLTCLCDLSGFPLEDVAGRKRDTGRRVVDRPSR
jgi:hypothetical protein